MALSLLSRLSFSDGGGMGLFDRAVAADVALGLVAFAFAVVDFGAFDPADDPLGVV